MKQLWKRLFPIGLATLSVALHDPLLWESKHTDQ